MKNKISGESLIGIVIGVSILGFALLGMVNIINFNKDITEDFNITINEYILKGNNENIIKKIDTSNINQNETFYIHKNESTKNYEVFTGGLNSDYKFINPKGNLVTEGEAIGKTYTREFIKRLDILKHIIYPNQIENIVFHYDANNIDGTNNSTLTDGDKISHWEDLSGNNIAPYQNSSSKKPQYIYQGINGLPYVRFDGNDILAIDDNALINQGPGTITYPERSLAIVLKTGDNVTTNQMIYEEGGVDRGYSFMIHDGDIYAGIWNETEWDTGHKYKSVNLGEAIPNSVHYIMVVHNSTSGVDSTNTLQIFLNGNLASEQTHVDIQYEHPNNIGLGGVIENTVYPFPPYENKNLAEGDYLTNGGVGELISWNHGLTKHEVRGIQNYFIQKWLRGKSNINYNIVDINIKKYNQ